MKILLPLLTLMLTCDHLTTGYRILGVFPIHGRSHWYMMEQLMKGLAKRGHQVDVVSFFPQKTPIPNYNDISLKTEINMEATNNLTADELKKFDSISMKHIIEMLSEVCKVMDSKQIQNLIHNPPKDPPYDLLISELFIMPCTIAMGPHLKVPTVGIITSRFQDWISSVTGNPHNTAYVPSLFSAFGQKMTFWERLKNTFLANFLSMQVNYYANKHFDYTREMFGTNFTVEDLYKEVALILVNSHFSVYENRPNTPAVVEVGGLHIPKDIEPLPPKIQKWLDESTHGCVLFTFGSMVKIESFPKEVLETFYKAFEKIAPIRVLMKVANEKDLLPGLPKNVMIQPWFPQMAILKHKNTKVFITHGGLMGTQESIYFGVPMIGMPLFGDQHSNLQNYVQKEVALSLGSPYNITTEQLTSALDTVLQNPVYQQNAEKLSQLFVDRPLSAIDTAIYWVEYVIRHGNVLQSPVIHLTWWERNLVDVYGFILLCAVLILSIALLLVRTLKNCLFGSKPLSRKYMKELTSKKKK